MTTVPSRPALPLFFPVEIPATWTSEQAVAVFDMITEIRDRIWDKYNVQIQLELENRLLPND